MFLQLPADVEHAVQQRRDKCAERGTILQPFLIVVVEETTVKSVYVSIYHSLYKVHSVLKRIDTCFNVFHMMN